MTAGEILPSHVNFPISGLSAPIPAERVKRMRVVVSGSLAYDRIMDFPGRFRDHILPGKIHVLNLSFAVSQLSERYGGTAGNIAYNLAMLGLRPTVVAAAGSDFGPYRAWLHRHGVDLAGVRTVPDDRTAAAYIITDEDDNQIAGFHAAAMGRRGIAPAAARLCRVAGAIVSPGNLEDMRILPVRYRRAGVPYLFDPGQQLASLPGGRLRSALGGAFGLVANDYELALTLRQTGWSAAQLAARVPVVAATLGPKGSRIRQGKKIWRIPPARPSRLVDPTGAGDAYRAGLLYGWLARWSWPVAGRFASLVAVYAVERAGAQTHRFTWAALRRRYRQNFGRGLPV